MITGPLEGFIDVDVTPEACVATFGAESDVGSGLIEVDGAGDVNHDGYDDIVVSMNRFPWDADTLGAVMIVPGPLNGELVPEDALFAVMPEVGTDGDETRLSADVSVGDVDGDGEADLLVVDGTFGTPTDGAPGATLFLGPLHGVRSWEEADMFITQHDGANRVGMHGELTDVDGDGAHEVRVMGPSGEYLQWWHETLLGFHALVPGDTDVTAADALVTCDEVDGPCFSDRIAWVAPSGNHGCGGMWLLAPLLDLPFGRGFPVYGMAAGEIVLSTWPYRIEGTTDWQAQARPAVADINGDGWVDVALGDSGTSSFNNGGTAPVLLGPFGGSISTDAAFVRYHGQGNPAIINGTPQVGHILDAGDVNADGYGDLLITSPGFSRPSSEDCNPYWYQFPGAAGCYEGAVFIIHHPSSMVGPDPREVLTQGRYK